MSNKEMLHRKQYRIAAVVAGLALAVSMTACGAQNNAEYPESVDTHSTGVYGTSIENEMASAVAGRETQAETLPSQEPEDALARETQTLQENSIPEAEETVPQSEALEAHGADQTETVSSQPAEYTDLQQITLNPDWEYADHSKINTGAAVLYRAPEESGSKGIIIGVNAGHGTAGGAKVKTLCHPDGSAKTTGGSTAAGATEAAAVSGGMTFQDGTPERTVTLQMAQILRDKLLASGYDVLMLRDGEDVQLDNVARTVICNNVADCHIALHWDSGDGKNYDKGCFYISVPEVLKSMEPVASHWQQHDALGADLVEGLRGQGATIYGKGNMSIDLTQTSYSTIPSVDMELGNAYSDHSDAILDQLAEGLLQGINVYFQQQ
ncbi:MAG: N-acetylmuramoyl-L-alanine amidase family protein [Waltera sp.]|uniref:N-acetylmuramoyl-L-alanine amidase family protein n=1 Tax=Waltera sp. TaxID=2815806 RepID=UPI0039954281